MDEFAGYHEKLGGAEVHYMPNTEVPTNQVIYVMAKGYLSEVMASTPLNPDDAIRYAYMIIDAARKAKLCAAQLESGF